MTSEHGASRRERILAQADQCVKCGLCLPHCPTYRLTQDESESPRGRISLMQAISLGELTAEPKLVAHLDSCLGCRSCETACPAKVEYGELLDMARAELRESGPPPRLLRALLWFVRRPRSLRALGFALTILQKLGAPSRVARANWLRRRGAGRLAALAPSMRFDPPIQPRHLPHGARRGRVALFSGCLASVFDRRAINAAIDVLTALGYEVDIPTEQRCCGALFQHTGDADTASELARRNLDAFDDDSYSAIIYLASGCGAELSDYVMRIDDARSRRFTHRLVEFSRFVSDHWPQEMLLNPLEARVLVHEPCTHRNVLGDAQSAYQALQRIPGLVVAPLPGNAGCCGAGGSNLITQAELADALAAPKLAAAMSAGADFIVTTNIGCALHLAAGLRQRGTDLRVLHPAELLARQLALRSAEQPPGAEHA